MRDFFQQKIHPSNMVQVDVTSHNVSDAVEAYTYLSDRLQEGRCLSYFSKLQDGRMLIPHHHVGSGGRSFAREGVQRTNPENTFGCLYHWDWKPSGPRRSSYCHIASLL
jgi:hypothetical protein